MGGYATHWRSVGQGPRPALFLHCSLGHSGAWGGLVSELKSDLNIIAMDLPGHGQSGPWKRDLDWQEQSARMAIALLETFDKPADIVGHSFGATVAIRIAVTRPALVRSLVLAEPVLFSVADEARAPEFQRHVDEVQIFPKLLAQGRLEDLAKAFIKMWGGGQRWEDIPAAQQRYMIDRMDIILTGEPSLFGIGDSVITLDMIGEIAVPVLLVEGSETHEIIPVITSEMQRVLPNSERLIVNGAGHMVPLTHVAEVAQEMRAFLSL